MVLFLATNNVGTSNNNDETEKSNSDAFSDKTVVPVTTRAVSTSTINVRTTNSNDRSSLVNSNGTEKSKSDESSDETQVPWRKFAQPKKR